MGRVRVVEHGMNVWPAFTDSILAFVLVLVLLFVFQVGKSIDIVVDQSMRDLLEDQESISQLIADQSRSNPSIALNKENISTQVITFGDRALFASGDAQLSKGGQNVLRLIAATITQKGIRTLYKIEVSGHTDNRPTGLQQYTNWELSTARATNVVRYLIASDLNPQQIELSAAGYGQFKPVAPNTSDAGRARNRRIEMKLIYRD